MIAQNIGFTAIFLIEDRTRVYGRVKKIRCGINKQVRARIIHKLFGLNILSFSHRGQIGTDHIFYVRYFLY